MKRIIFALLCFITLLCIVSCSSEPVSVSLNGGSMDLVIDKKTKLETVASTTPTKDGYVFAGWYSDAGFADYIAPHNVTKQQKNQGTAYAKWIDVPKVKTYDVRREQVSITDSGRDKQQLDCVGLAADYNIVDLRRAGYTSFKITLTALISEKDDGYQYFFLYSSSQCASSGIDSVADFYDKYILGEDKSDPDLLAAQRFDHGSTGIDTSSKLVTVEKVISLADLTNDVYIRYGASGKDDDTWYNEEITVKVTPIGGPVDDKVDDSIDPELADFIALVKTTPTREGYIFAGWYSDERFTDYINPYYLLDAQKQSKTAYPKWIEDKGSVEYTVRALQATITDDGRDEQQLDTVRIGADFPISDLIRAGYRYLTVKVYMEISEENDGYQYVFIYSNSTSTDEDGLLSEHKYDHGGSGVTGWSPMIFTSTVAIDDITDSLYLRYGASGDNEDTWYNKNVKVTITATK